MEGRTGSASPKANELLPKDVQGTDFSDLRRSILAAQQTARILTSESARSDLNVQEKLISAIEIAKEALAEAGISIRPFVFCRTDSLQYRKEYFDVLKIAEELSPYVNNPEMKLRLKRLLLPLSATARFKVSFHSTDDGQKNSMRPSALNNQEREAPKPPASKDVKRDSLTAEEQSSPCKRQKVTSDNPQRSVGVARSSTPGPSSPPAAAQHPDSRPVTSVWRAKQQARTSAISSDVSQRVLVRRATQTMTARPNARPPPKIRISPFVKVPSPELSSSPTSSPSPSPSPPLASLPSITPLQQNTPQQNPPQPSSPSSADKGPEHDPALFEWSMEYEAAQKGWQGSYTDYPGYTRGGVIPHEYLPGVPPEVILCGSWSDVPLINPDDPFEIPEHLKTSTPLGPEAWVLKDTAPPASELQQRAEPLSESTCTSQ